MRGTSSYHVPSSPPWTRTKTPLWPLNSPLESSALVPACRPRRWFWFGLGPLTQRKNTEISAAWIPPLRRLVLPLFFFRGFPCQVDFPSWVGVPGDIYRQLVSRPLEMFRPPFPEKTSKSRFRVLLWVLFLMFGYFSTFPMFFRVFFSPAKDIYAGQLRGSWVAGLCAGGGRQWHSDQTRRLLFELRTEDDGDH